jgi:anti-sigma regulatory factor (Ser/Thr protein kinase)
MTVQTPDILPGARDHVVQFYDEESELARSVGGYLTRAVRAGDASVVIATPAHRNAFQAELSAAGIDLNDADREGAIVWLDAVTTLRRLMPQGRIDPEAARAALAAIVREAANRGREVRAYGEMVALLWDDGDVLSAIELEKLWNELADEFGFSLWCAYHGNSLAVHEHADELREVCHLHTSVVQEATARFLAGSDAPMAARRFVSSVLARRPYEGRVKAGDAKLVISELATNAVVHAGTPFSVSVRPTGSTVRISVRDSKPAHPRLRNARPNDLSGRGLHLVAATADGWGVEPDPGGKTVWAELPLD